MSSVPDQNRGTSSVLTESRPGRAGRRHSAQPRAAVSNLCLVDAPSGSPGDRFKNNQKSFQDLNRKVRIMIPPGREGGEPCLVRDPVVPYRKGCWVSKGMKYVMLGYHGGSQC